jgi:hypothetical protein
MKNSKIVSPSSARTSGALNPDQRRSRASPRRREGIVRKAISLMLVVAVSAPTCFAVGALARNPRNNESIVVVDKPSKDVATHDAIFGCGSDCEIVITFQHACVAYAADHKANSTVYGYGKAADEHTAGEQALDQCESRGGSCTVMASGCDKSE